RQPQLMVRRKLFDANAQSVERQSVRRQYERVGGQTPEAVQRREIFPQWIGLGLMRHYADHWGDLGEHLVSGNQDVVLSAPKRCVCGRMAAADHHLPFTPTEAQGCAVSEAHELFR